MLWSFFFFFFPAACFSHPHEQVQLKDWVIITREIWSAKEQMSGRGINSFLKYVYARIYRRQGEYDIGICIIDGSMEMCLFYLNLVWYLN